MKKYVLGLGLITTLMTSCEKDNVVAPIVEQPISKTVEFTIVPAADYSHPSYANSTAEMKLQVYKQFSNPYSVQVIWDTTIARQPLGSFIPNTTVVKTFNGIKESEYKIGVGYSISYLNTQFNSQSWSAMGEVIQNGNVTHKVQVGL